MAPLSKSTGCFVHTGRASRLSCSFTCSSSRCSYILMLPDDVHWFWTTDSVTIPLCAMGPISFVAPHRSTSASSFGKAYLYFYTQIPKNHLGSREQTPKILKWKRSESQWVKRHGKSLPLLTLHSLKRGEWIDPESTVTKAGLKKGTELCLLANK